MNQGVAIRSDVVDVYVFRVGEPRAPATGGIPEASTREDALGTRPVAGALGSQKQRSRERGPQEVEFLQLRRVGDDDLASTWHPIMGHIEPGETAVACAWRELREEIGLHANDPGFVGLWALEQVHPFFLASKNCVMLSPRFACEVSREWTPRLNHEHDAHRWIPQSRVREAFLWPGQRACCTEIVEHLLVSQTARRLVALPPPA